MKAFVKGNRRIILSVKLLTCWELFWVSSKDFERQSEHASECHKICALPGDEQKENCVNTCHNLQGGLKENSKFDMKISQVMRHWLQGTTQNVSNSRFSRRAHHLHAHRKATQFIQMWRAYSLFFFQHSRSCALWICSTSIKGKPTLFHWHLIASVGKCVAKSTWEVEYGGVVSPPWQCTCSLCFVCVWISGQKHHCHFTPSLLSRFSARKS